MSKERGRGPKGERFRGMEIEELAFCLDDAETETLTYTDGEDGDSTGEKVTSRVKVFPNKELHHPSSPDSMNFDNKFRTGMVRSFKSTGLNVQVDFNHASSPSPFQATSFEQGRACFDSLGKVYSSTPKPIA